MLCVCLYVCWWMGLVGRSEPETIHRDRVERYVYSEVCVQLMMSMYVCGCMWHVCCQASSRTHIRTHIQTQQHLHLYSAHTHTHAHVSSLTDATVFWPAEEYHQKYLERGGRHGNPQSAKKGDKTAIRCYG